MIIDMTACLYAHRSFKSHILKRKSTSYIEIPLIEGLSINASLCPSFSKLLLLSGCYILRTCPPTCEKQTSLEVKAC